MASVKFLGQPNEGTQRRFLVRFSRLGAGLGKSPNIRTSDQMMQISVGIPGFVPTGRSATAPVLPKRAMRGPSRRRNQSRTTGRQMVGRRALGGQIRI